MRIAHALLIGAVLVSWLLPRLLDRLDLRQRDPVPLIVCWLLSMTGVALTVLTGVALLLTSRITDTSGLTASALHCWHAVQHGSPPRLEAFGDLLGTTFLVVIVARAAVLAARARKLRRQARHDHLTVLRLAARMDAGPPPTLWLAHDRPLAFSLGGRPGTVVATEGLLRHLDPTTVAAVLAHERAHLRGRHHLMVAVAESLRAALPFLPLFQRAPGALRHLVEVAADICAVRACGQTAVRSALEHVTGHDAPGTALAVGADAVDLRLSRLDGDAPLPNRLRRAACCSMAALLALTAPFVASLSLVLMLSLLGCLSTS